MSIENNTNQQNENSEHVLDYTPEEIEKINAFEKKMNEEHKEFVLMINAYVSKNMHLIAGYKITTVFNRLDVAVITDCAAMRKAALRQ